jgi:xanthine dehydrogenase YagR molybdenum-binding subunit
MYVANVFGLKMKNVQVICTVCRRWFWFGASSAAAAFMAVMASLALKRNVRVTLDRAQMYMIGHRPPTLQHTKFGADKE